MVTNRRSLYFKEKNEQQKGSTMAKGKNSKKETKKPKKEKPKVSATANSQPSQPAIGKKK